MLRSLGEYECRLYLVIWMQSFGLFRVYLPRRMTLRQLWIILQVSFARAVSSNFQSCQLWFEFTFGTSSVYYLHRPLHASLTRSWVEICRVVSQKRPLCSAAVAGSPEDAHVPLRLPGDTRLKMTAELCIWRKPDKFTFYISYIVQAKSGFSVEVVG
jgi:hypothetical protein